MFLKNQAKLRKKYVVKYKKVICGQWKNINFVNLFILGVRFL